jgi:flavin reductase (DIM6/NTAB) family NADH-FMN oxidoreductase RutF
LVLFCAGKSSTSWPHIQRAGRFCVNVLAHDQRFLCQTFATQSEDKFQDVRWSESPNGSPMIDDCLAWVECDIVAVHPGGDHDVVIGRVTDLEARAAGEPLVFFRSGYGSFSQAVRDAG